VKITNIETKLDFVGKVMCHTIKHHSYLVNFSNTGWFLVIKFYKGKILDSYL